MGLWIAPSACIAALLAPIGLDEPALRLMGAGIERVLTVAHWVGGLPGAVVPVGAAPVMVLAAFVIGGLWLMLWRGPWRFTGFGLLGAGLLAWANPPARPDVLIAPEGRLVGIMTPDGRVLDHDRAQSFAARSWLRRDGDVADQVIAAARKGIERQPTGLTAALPHGWMLDMRRKNAQQHDLQSACAPRTLLLGHTDQSISGPCIYLGPRDLRHSGALAIHVTAKGVKIVRSRNPSIRRLWTP